MPFVVFSQNSEVFSNGRFILNLYESYQFQSLNKMKICGVDKGYIHSSLYTLIRGEKNGISSSLMFTVGIVMVS